MRRAVFAMLLSVILFLSAGCGQRGQGTYYPNDQEMQNNLEHKGYQVRVEALQADPYSGMYLTAEKGTEYIAFYWLDDGKYVADLEKELEEKYDDYGKLVSIKEDNTFGSLVFCSTEAAMNDAGITIVEVKIS